MSIIFAFAAITIFTFFNAGKSTIFIFFPSKEQNLNLWKSLALWLNFEVLLLSYYCLIFNENENQMKIFKFWITEKLVIWKIFTMQENLKNFSLPNFNKFSGSHRKKFDNMKKNFYWFAFQLQFWAKIRKIFAAIMVGFIIRIPAIGIRVSRIEKDSLRLKPLAKNWRPVFSSATLLRNS